MNPYRVLGLPDNASLEEARKAYHRLGRKYHPDRLGRSADAETVKKYTDICTQINIAYGMIKDGYRVSSVVAQAKVGFTHVDIMHFKIV